MEAIKATDRLPEVGVPVLFWRPLDEWAIGKLLEGGTHWLPDGYGFRVKVGQQLYWSPLPPAPPVAISQMSGVPGQPLKVE